MNRTKNILSVPMVWMVLVDVLFTTLWLFRRFHDHKWFEDLSVALFVLFCAVCCWITIWQVLLVLGIIKGLLGPMRPGIKAVWKEAMWVVLSCVGTPLLMMWMAFLMKLS